MAESILFNLAGSLITELGSLATRELALLWGVADELEKLKDTVSTIKAVLLDAEEQESKSNSVKHWVSRLKDAFYDVDDLMDEFSYETSRRQVLTRGRTKSKWVRIFFSKSNQIAFNFQMGHKINKIREKLDAIAADKTQFHFYESMVDTRDDGLRKGRETYSFILEGEVIGREDDKKAIIDLLLDTNFKEDIAVIAIVGMGGLGKTALAQSVYNDKMIAEYFELKLWVCISEEFDVKIIVEKIVEYATMKRPESLEMHSLQSRLQKEIDGKKYLLIMDDVWNENYEKWVNLKRLLMGGANGSRILITTRSKQVAETFDVLSLYSLENLNEDNSWLLFKKMASLNGGEEELENPNLVEIGKEIVAKLKGVPLAIRIIGRLLYLKKSEVDWLNFKDNELSRVMQQGNEMQSILKISYKHLPSNLKQCFAYCALFPKDYEIRKDEMIKQWVAQGFIQPHGIKAIEDVGDDYFMELLWRSFFQDIRNNQWGDIKKCKMHDLMHDLACSILENECVVASMDVVGPIDKRTRHVSLGSNSYKRLELPESLIEAKNLRTLLYCPPIDYDKTIGEIFSHHLRLRTLVLRHGYITNLPRSISKLKHLRYLDLAENDSVKFLPNSITELYNLETLILRDCWRLKELPRDTKNLIKLRHLDLHGCDELTRMPKGLGGLTSLQTLNLFVAGWDRDSDSGLNELNGLNNLRGSLTVDRLQFWTNADLEKTANYLKLKQKIRKLELKWDWKCYRDVPTMDALDDYYKIVLECLQPHSNVREILISGYNGVRLCNWLSSNSLVRDLISIELSFCMRLRHLPQFDQFPFLKHLCLKSLICIEYIDDNNDHLSSSTFFPSLEKLRISKMPNLKGWWKGGESSSESARSSNVLFRKILPCLSKIEIFDCRRLVSIPWNAPLQSLEIDRVSWQLLKNMVMKVNTKLDVESSLFTPSKLSSLCLEDIEDLKFLPKELFSNLTNLEDLKIANCRNFQMSYSRVGVVQHAIPIKEENDDDDDDDILWKELGSLRSLCLLHLPKLEYLPKGLQHVTTLQHVSMSDCPNLRSLPEWIDNFTSLSTLVIDNCPKLTSLPEGICHLTSLSKLIIGSCPNLTSLPEGMRHLHSLQTLLIVECPKLEERCKKGVGEDWPKIAHVPNCLL